jgi:uncharacterized membrane protein YbhN (UPF0104 family)
VLEQKTRLVRVFCFKINKNLNQVKGFAMSKLDEVKEILNTLRLAMSLFFGLFVILVGALISYYDQARFNELFWLGVGSAFIVLVVIMAIVKKISDKTKEIGEL